MKNRRGLTAIELLVCLAIIAIGVMLIVDAIVKGSGGSGSTDDADARQAAETKQSLAEADRQIGMPDITRFQERKLAKDILELRDKELPTFTYVMNMHGELVFLGESIGYGLPYSVQFTNPAKVTVHKNSYDAGDVPYTTPQADPNGLYMPESAAATWVMLKGPDGRVHPVYVEYELIVSPFRLQAVNTSRPVNAENEGKS